MRKLAIRAPSVQAGPRKSRAAGEHSAPAPRKAGARATNRRWLFAGGAAVAIGSIGAVSFRSGRARPTETVNLDLDLVTVDPPALDLGRVRLDVVVPVTVRLLNQSRKTIILGQATAEALEGC